MPALYTGGVIRMWKWIKERLINRFKVRESEYEYEEYMMSQGFMCENALCEECRGMLLADELPGCEIE